LNYKTHTIFNLDIAGAASPDPGIPYFEGTPALKEYLLSQGIRYIAHVPFDDTKFLHSRSRQRILLHGTMMMWVYLVHFELDFQDNVDALAQTNRVLYDSPTLRIIDLGN